MPLKLTVLELSEIPEAQRGLYRARQEGGFILDVEGGAVAKSTLDEFRTKNIELMKQIQGAGDIDPVQVAALRDDNARLTAELQTARKGASADAEARIKAIEKGRDGLRQQLESVLIDQQVARIAADVGAHPGAIDDIATRIRSRFRLSDDGQPVAVDAAGDKIFGEDGKPLGIDGAVRQLTKQAPHLFRQSSGGSAANASASGGRITHGGSNPWKKETFNATDQARIMKTDRATAERLAAEAGTTLPDSR